VPRFSHDGRRSTDAAAQIHGPSVHSIGYSMFTVPISRPSSWSTRSGTELLLGRNPRLPLS
jgi:hypothetical protein